MNRAKERLELIRAIANKSSMTDVEKLHDIAIVLGVPTTVAKDPKAGSPDGLVS